MEQFVRRLIRGPFACLLLLSAGVAAQAVVWERARSPGSLLDAEAAYDVARQRVVLFGGLPVSCDHCPEAQRSDTWEWDGVRWLRRDVAVAPPGRRGHSMVYDAARQRVVLFGGGNRVDVATFTDLWEWDGATWTQRATNLPATYAPAVAYDNARRKIIVLGIGMWTWDGANLSILLPSVRPRGAGTMTYDSVRQRVVFAGRVSTSTFVETWEWDGSAWTQRTPPSSPPWTLGLLSMVFDSVRQRVVLLEGASTPTTVALWEWDGAAWTRRNPSLAPQQRYGAAIAYDDARQRTILFGGYSPAPAFVVGDTWEWDGQTWSLRAIAGSPGYVRPQAMAYDASRQRTFMFSGVGYPPQPNLWAWDGSVWTQMPPSLPGPAGRFSPAMAYDANRQRTVLVGGSDEMGTVLRDTWEWDGAQWTLAHVAGPPWSFAAMAYDSRRGRMVFFGGFSSGSGSSETWEWDGAQWQRRVVALAPPPRSEHRMAYDVARQRVVLFGGDSGFSSLGDTWEWDGVTWMLASNTGPSPRRNPSLFYDGRRRRTVLAGGGLPLTMNDTWEWDGVNWTRLSVAGSPNALGGPSAYDSARDQGIVFVQGATSLLGPRVAPTTQVIGPGCGGATQPPRLISNDPFLGNRSFTLDLLDARALSASVIGIAGAAQAQAIGRCTLYVRDVIFWLGATTDVRGAALARIPLPTQPALRGVALFAQAFVVDPAAGAFGLAFSSGWRLQFGD